MSTDDHTNIEPKRSVYDTCDPQYLRELREAVGMDLVRLARIACLSVSQVRQLETHGSESSFYSEAIKRQAYRRLLMILGAEPPSVEVPEALHDTKADLQTLDQIVAMSHQPAMSRAISNALSASAGKLKNKKQVVGLLLFVAVILFAVQELKNTHDLTALIFPPTSEPDLEQSNSPVVASTATEPVAVASSVIPATAASCASTNESMPQLTPIVAQKEGRYVYLVSNINAEVCVVDGNQQATVLQMKAGENRSVYGVSPWQVSSASLSKIQVFFQGGRVPLPDMATRVKLLEVPVLR